MSLWEYKVITSGKGGFATPALLEKFLNDLGREEWEIVEFHTQSDNFLAFTGLARRPTQRDWTLEGAAAAAAKAEADKLRAEFEAKFKAATTPATAEEPASFLEEKVGADDGFRKPVDTSHDADAEEDEAKPEDDWDKMTAAEEDELPTFFDAIKPHMRRNQRGPGMSVGVDFLAKKWDQSEEDIKGALVECGFTVPEDEDAKAEYLEFEGDLYWVNVNRRGELWINTKEKPRPVFRTAKGQKVAAEEEPAPGGQKHEPKGRHGGHNKHDAEPRQREGIPEASSAAPAETPKEAAAPSAEQPEVPGQPLPSGPALLETIRPFMRRNRRGPGGSGSASFLSRALKCREADLVAGFKTLGLVVPSSPNEKPTNVVIGNHVWWINTDSRGNVWINGRDKNPGETIESLAAGAQAPTESTATASETTTEGGAPAPIESAPATAAPDAVPAPEIAPAATRDTRTPLAPAPSAGDGTLAAVRPLLKQTKTGAVASKLERVAEAYGKSPDELVAALVAAGLAVPEKPREKPVFVEHGGEIFWLNRNAKGELWLNAKASKFADAAGSSDESSGGESEGGDAGAEKKPRRPRGRRKSE